MHSYALVGVHICTNYALVTGGQDGVWGRFLDSGHMLEKVLEKILLVQLMKNQKSDSEDYLTKSNYLNKTYSFELKLQQKRSYLCQTSSHVLKYLRQ